MQALAHAEHVLAWHENLSREEIPPKWMWHLDHELKVWFEEVELARQTKYGDDSPMESAAPMTQNELARGMRD